MKEQFVPYELAVKLKQLGFDEECFGWYNCGELNIYGDDRLLDTHAANEDLRRPNAPLWQQALKFLYEKSEYKINITIDGKDNQQSLSEKFEQAIKNIRDL